ncbi:hypothetical protein HXX76_000735 [Chlamydomonas incerta]|uniref:DUF1996 domain-containing protein n=1 Tax=Chlamydomonas incerta TaxID=51695 RepID=A0A836B399_CHLIN|nr:hypothetical protein HXX76_000735 [Chlamydomonas incerta]|eukprot:KAG2446138.1 hypothetical protein HXX76_000735 [Chlamydomonas incerta]
MLFGWLFYLGASVVPAAAEESGPSRAHVHSYVSNGITFTFVPFPMTSSGASRWCAVTSSRLAPVPLLEPDVMLWLAQQALRITPGLLQADIGASATGLEGSSDQQSDAAVLDPAAMAAAPAALGPPGSPLATAGQQLQEQVVWMGDLPLPLEMLAWCPGTSAQAAPAPGPPSGEAAAASCRPAVAAVLGSTPCWARYACDDARTPSLTAPFLCASLPPGSADADTIVAYSGVADGGYGGMTGDDSPPPTAPPPQGGADSGVGGVLGLAWRQAWRASTQEGVLATPSPPSPPSSSPTRASTPGPPSPPPASNAASSNTPRAPPLPAPGCPGPDGSLAGCAAIWKLGDPFVGLAQVMRDNGIMASPPPPGQQPPAPPRQSWLASSKGAYAVLAVATFCGALVVMAVALAAYLDLFPAAKLPAVEAVAAAADAGAAAGAAGGSVGAAAAPSATAAEDAPASAASAPGAAGGGTGGGRGQSDTAAAVMPGGGSSPGSAEDRAAGRYIILPRSSRTISACGSEATARTSPAASDPRTSANSINSNSPSSNRSRALSVHVPLRALVIDDADDGGGCGNNTRGTVALAPSVAARSAWCADGSDGDIVPGLPPSVVDAARSSYSWRRRGGGSWRDRGGASSSGIRGSSSGSPSGGAVGSAAGVAGSVCVIQRTHGHSDDGRSAAAVAHWATVGASAASAYTAATEAAALPPNAVASPGGGAAPCLPAVPSAADEALPPGAAAAATAAAGMPQPLLAQGTGASSPGSRRSLRASAPTSGNASKSSMGGTGSSSAGQPVAAAAAAGTAMAPATANGDGTFSLYADLLAESLELRRRRRSCVAMELRAETPRGGDKV